MSRSGRSDVTYLESFIEHISTLPHEVRRNLDLMKDLDRSCSTLFEELSRRQQDYIHRIEEKILKLQVVENGTKVCVLNNNGSNNRKRKHSEDENDDDNKEEAIPSVIPTTEELAAYIHSNDDNETLDTTNATDAASASATGKSSNIPTNQALYQHIQSMQQDSLQRAEEKVAIAQQTYSLVDATCKRLDNDLQEMEKLLQANGAFETPGTAKPNDLAAIQVTPGSPDWILAKVITHDPQTGMFKLSDEDVESSKIFNLPETQVVILGGLKNLSRGDIIYAVYPDTTSFYQATVVQGPRKLASSSSSGNIQGVNNSATATTPTGNNTFVMVHFVDDGDEHGITHDKAVSMKHVMLPPYGVTLQ